MTAGLILRGDIWDFSYPSDDTIGGAVPTGTVLYANVGVRISTEKPTLALLEQGLMTPRIYTAIIYPNNASSFALTENYQLEIVGPPLSEHYNKFFVIIGVQPASVLDKRKFWKATLRREEKATSNLLQT